MSIFTRNICLNFSTKVAHLCLAFCCLCHPHMHINGGDGARGAVAPLAWGGQGGPPPSRDSTAFFSVLVNVHMQNLSKLSEMLLPANSMWNFVASAHLPYLNSFLRVCVEGRAWVRVGVSRALKASLRLYLKLRCDCTEASSTVAAKQLVYPQRSSKYSCSEALSVALGSGT